MSLKAFVIRHVSTWLTSPARRDRRRVAARRKRIAAHATPRVHFFHQADDPYSHLAAQLLPAIAARYAIALQIHLVSPPNDAAAPERERLRAYGVRDAARVARRYNLAWPQDAKLQDTARIVAANAALAGALTADNFSERALAIGNALWRGEAIPPSNTDPKTALAEGDKLRAELGHYLGGMFYFESEWYWGVDRLHHLEARLRGENLDRSPAAPFLAPFQEMALDGQRGTKSLTIEFWFSFRSPYSWIAAPRVHRLAGHYGADVRWRFILPMVMRGLPVPPVKRNYITLDVKREAEMVGLPYGTIVDPVGEGARRALAVFHRAIAKGRGAEFAESGLKAAFADGIDLASRNGLEEAAVRAGLTPEDVTAALADTSWQAVAEENRKALFEAGLWGAPTYRVNGGEAHWGQDRLWTLEEDIKGLIAS